MNWLNEMLQNDPDPTESREWIESIKAVIDHDGVDRAHQLLEGMVELTRRAGANLPFMPTTAQAVICGSSAATCIARPPPPEKPTTPIGPAHH